MDNVFGYQRQDQSVLPTESFGTNYGRKPASPVLTVRRSGRAASRISILLASDSLRLCRLDTGVPDGENFTMSHNFTWVKSAHEIRFRI